MKQNKNFKGDLVNLSLGLTLAVGFVFFVVVGSFIDNKRGHGHIGVLTGILLGFIFDGYEIWKFIKQNNNEPKK